MSWVPGYTDTGGGSGPDYGGIFPPWDQGGTPPATSPGYPPEGAPPNTPFPGSPPSQPYPDVPYGPPAPEPQQPPPSDPYIAPSGWSGDLSPFFAGIPSFFRSRVGRRLPSPFEQLVRRSGTQLVKGLADYFRGGRVLDAPPSPPVKPPMLRPNWYPPPAGPGLGIGALVGPILTGVALALYPRGLGREAPLTAAERVSDPNALFRQWDPRMMGLPTPREPDVYRDPRRVPDMLLENIPAPARPVDTGFRAFLRRELAGQGSDYGPDWLRRQLGLPQVFSQRGQTVPEPPKQNIADIRTAPTPNSTVPSQVLAPRSRTGPRSRRNRIFTFGGIGTAVLLLEAARRGRSSSPSVGGAVPPVLNPIAPTPLTPLVPSVQSYPQSAGGVNSFGGDGYCVPRPRGPRRKCLERAPVKYSGGRRKGKAAGTKCLRWEAPKR